MNVFEMLKSSALGAAIGAYSSVNDVVGKVARSDALEAVVVFIMERLQDQSEMGILTRCDAGKVAPALIRTLSMLRTAAGKHNEWIIQHFLIPRVLQALLRPDPMDLVFAMRGLQGAAREAAGEAWAIERTLRHLQYPLAPLLPADPHAASMLADPWLHIEDLGGTPAEQAEPPAVMSAAEVAATALWLEQRIRYVTTRNLDRLQEELTTLYDEQFANPAAVTAALAELQALTGFTIWLAQRIERAAWRAVVANR